MKFFIGNLALTTLVCSVLILGIIFITPLLKKHTRKWRYIAFILIGVRLLFPIPFFENGNALISIPIREAAVEINENVKGEAVKTNEYQNADNVSDYNEMEKKSLGSGEEYSLASIGLSDFEQQEVHKFDFVYSENIITLMFFLWLLGVISFALYYVILYQYNKSTLKRWSIKIIDQKYIGILEEEKEKLGIADKIEVLRCKKVKTPILFGLIHSKILLPDMEYDADKLKYIYRHELIHKKHKDMYGKLFFSIIRCMYWFNPIVHLMIKNAFEDMEMLCDDTVVADMEQKDRIAYNEVLLNIAKLHTKRWNSNDIIFLFGFVPWRNHLKERMINVMHVGKRKKGYSIIALVFVMLLISSNIICYREEGINIPVQAKTLPETSNVIDHILSDDELREVSRNMKADELLGHYLIDGILSVAAHEEQEYGYLYVDENKYYWKCIELAVKSCHNSGFLIGIKSNKNDSRFVLDKCSNQWFFTDEKVIIRYEVNESIVEELGKAFLGKALSPDSIPEDENIIYNAEKHTYFISFDNTINKDYGYIIEDYQTGKGGTQYFCGGLSNVKTDLELRTHKFQICVTEDATSKLFGFHISNIDITPLKYNQSASMEYSSK